MFLIFITLFSTFFVLYRCGYTRFVHGRGICNTYIGKKWRIFVTVRFVLTILLRVLNFPVIHIVSFISSECKFKCSKNNCCNVKYKLTKRRQLLNFNLERVHVIFYNNYIMQHLTEWILRYYITDFAMLFLNTVDFYVKQSALNNRLSVKVRLATLLRAANYDKVYRL